MCDVCRWIHETCLLLDVHACADHSAVECLMRLLICLMEAEAAYSAAMATAAKTASAGPLTAPSDSSNLLAALEGMVALPAAAAAGHRQLYLELQVLGTSLLHTPLQSLYKVALSKAAGGGWGSCCPRACFCARWLESGAARQYCIGMQMYGAAVASCWKPYIANRFHAVATVCMLLLAGASGRCKRAVAALLRQSQGAQAVCAHSR